MKLAKLFPALILSAASLCAADAAISDFLPPGTKIVLGIRIRTLADSQMVKGALTQAQVSKSDWLKIAGAMGFDPLRDLDEVMIATTGAGQNPPTLVVASGRFDVARLGEHATRYHDVPLLGGEKPADGVVALLDSNTALAGDRPMVLAAIDRRGAAPDAALAARVASLRGHYDVWGVGERPEGYVPTAQAKSLDIIDRFQFGMSVQQGLELVAELHARSAKDAEQLNATLGLVSAMLKSQPSTGARFDLQAEKSTFKLTVTIPEEELKKAMEAQSGALAQMLAARSGAAAPPKEEPKPAPKKPIGPPPPPVVDKDGSTVVLTLPGGKR